MARIENKPGDATYSKELAQQFIKQLRIQGQITVAQVIQQTAEGRLRLRDRINRKWEDGTRQKSLLDLDFELIEKTDETYTPPEAVRKKRTIADV